MADLPAISSQPIETSAARSPTARAAAGRDEKALREAARRFEQSFIAQMLTQSGLADALIKGGGKGADAFTSFYVDQLAEQISDNGGFGMAETIYKRLAQYRDQLDPGADATSMGESNARSVEL